MGIKDEDFTWITRQRRAALEAVADVARRVVRAEIITEQDEDDLSDAVFTLDRS